MASLALRPSKVLVRADRKRLGDGGLLVGSYSCTYKVHSD